MVHQKAAVPLILNACNKQVLFFLAITLQKYLISGHVRFCILMLFFSYSTSCRVLRIISETAIFLQTFVCYNMAVLFLLRLGKI
jgi:hypothetical protein